MATIEFWYEFASTYSYPAAMRIEKTVAEKGIEVIWRPFLLGPIFAQQGWNDSPFNIYRAKGIYMWRDMERICKAQKIAFQRPSLFPQHSLRAARCALTPTLDGQRAAFSKKVYQAAFVCNQDISQIETLSAILGELGVDAQKAMDEAASDAIKTKLRTNTDSAMEKGIFGAPSFVTPDNEIFWGNDRLEQAVAWTAA